MKRVRKLAIIAAVVIVLLFALLAPFIPTTVSKSDAAEMRHQCLGPVNFLANIPQYQVWTSASYYITQFFGAAYLPKGVPFSSDGSGYYIVLSGYPPISCG